MTLITVISRHLSHLTPIIFEFKKKVDTHIIITDEDKEYKEKTEELYNGIKRLNKKYNLKPKIKIFVIDEDDKSDFNKLFLKLKKIIKSKIYLNINEADTTFTILISAFVFKNKGKIISYDKNDNTYNLISQDKIQNHIIKNNMKIDDYMILLDYKIETKTIATDIIDRKEDILKIGKPKILKKIKNLLIRNAIHSKYEKELKNLKIVKNNKINNSAAGNIFEEYLFWEFYQYDIDDIALNIRIISDIKSKTLITNEFDILMIKDNHIFVVEAKFGSLIYNSTKAKVSNDIIYKADSLLSLFGEDSKTLVVNITKENIFSHNALVRAKSLNIDIYQNTSLDSLYKKVQEHFNIKKRAFLLGGMDLEMAEIENILKKYNQIVFNKNLNWGAKLSSYKNQRKKDYHFYGIELIEDIQPPKNYTKIDHHNEFYKKPSSIEQIAKLLNIKLNRYQKLVALNDKGYIPAMEKFGATKEEIESIRQKDRFYQGVTKEDEKLAKESLKNIEIINNIKIIYALCDKFSAISDRIYPTKDYIIYNDKKIIFYGNIKPLIKIFNNLIKENKAYYGKNFFGIVENVFTKEEIKKIKQKGLQAL